MERSSKIKRHEGNSNNYLGKKRNRDSLERNFLIRKFINRKLEGEYENIVNIFSKLFAFDWDDEKIVKHKINQSKIISYINLVSNLNANSFLFYVNSIYFPDLLKNIPTKCKKEIPQFLEKLMELFGGNVNIYKKHSPVRAKAKFLNDIRDFNFLLNKKVDNEIDNKINNNNALDIEHQNFLNSLDEKIPAECLIQTATNEFNQNNLDHGNFSNFTEKSSTIDELIEELNLKYKLLNKKNLNLANKLSTRFNYEEARIDHREILNNNSHEPNLLRDMEYTSRYKDEYLNSIKNKHNEYKKYLHKKQPYINFKDAFNQHEDQTTCQVCNTEDYEDKDLIVYCARCELTVHQTCYGIIDLPSEDWLCEPCREFSLEEVYGLECLLCPVKGGAMKRTEFRKSTSLYKYIHKLRNNSVKIRQTINTVDLLSPSSISNSCNINQTHIPTNSTILADHLETPTKFQIISNNTVISTAIMNSNITNTTSSSENEEVLSMSLAASAINTIYKTNIPQFTVVKEPTRNNTEFAWIHMACALWNPDVEIANFEKKEEIRNFEAIPKERFKEKCSICKLKNYGPTKKCHDAICVTKFHVECARINSCSMEVADVNGVLDYQIFCLTHRPNKLLKTIETRRSKIKEDVKSFSEIILKNLNNFEKEYKYSLLKYERKKISLKSNKEKKINIKENLSSNQREVKKDSEEKIILSLKEKYSFISQLKYACKLYSNYNLITLKKIKKESLNRKNSEIDNLYSFDFNSFKNKIKFSELKGLKNFPWSLIRIKNYNLNKIKKLFHYLIPDESTYNKKILKRKLKHKDKKFIHNKDKVELKNNNYVNIIYENGNEPAIENYEIDENLYCYCRKICSEGDIMINCEFENECKGAFQGWFHKKCVVELKWKSRKSINDSNFKFTCKECKEFNENNKPTAIIETKLDTIPENKNEEESITQDLCSK